MIITRFFALVLLPAFLLLCPDGAAQGGSTPGSSQGGSIDGNWVADSTQETVSLDRYVSVYDDADGNRVFASWEMTPVDSDGDGVYEDVQLGATRTGSVYYLGEDGGETSWELRYRDGGSIIVQIDPNGADAFHDISTGVGGEMEGLSAGETLQDWYNGGNND